MGIPYIPGNYAVGGVIAVPVMTEVGVISHKGILSDRIGDDGLPMVIHNAKLFDAVIEASMTVFCLKAVGPVSSEGYPGELPPLMVLARARSQIESPWRLWNNCEHFVHWAHGQKKKSPQLRKKAGKVAMWTGVAAACFFVFKPSAP
jgi:hypothetical protein